MYSLNMLAASGRHSFRLGDNEFLLYNSSRPKYAGQHSIWLRVKEAASAYESLLGYVSKDGCLTVPGVLLRVHGAEIYDELVTMYSLLQRGEEVPGLEIYPDEELVEEETDDDD